MGLVFSWLWNQREVAPPLLVVTTETQVSLNQACTQSTELLNVLGFSVA